MSIYGVTWDFSGLILTKSGNVLWHDWFVIVGVNLSDTQCVCLTSKRKSKWWGDPWNSEKHRLETKEDGE